MTLCGAMQTPPPLQWPRLYAKEALLITVGRNLPLILWRGRFSRQVRIRVKQPRWPTPSVLAMSHG